MKTIRYGIASTASIASRFIDALRETDNGVPVAIFSRNAEKGRRYADDHQLLKAYDSLEEMLKDEEIDAIYIPTINSLHYEYAREALLAGKHVLVEKPMGLYRWQIEDLIRISQERNLFIAEAIKAPFLPVYQDITEVIKSEKYGKICYMEFKQSYTGSHYGQGWHADKELGGGVLYGNEAYFFCMSEYLGGKIIDNAGCATYSRPNNIDDQCTVTITLENDILATNTVSTRVLLDNGLVIHLEKARIYIPDYWKARKAWIAVNGETVETFHHPCEHELKYELQHYNECMLGGLMESPVTPMEATARYIGICEEMYRRWDEVHIR